MCKKPNYMVEHMNQLEEGLYVDGRNVYRVVKDDREKWVARHGVETTPLLEGSSMLGKLEKLNLDMFGSYLSLPIDVHTRENSNTVIILGYLLERNAQLEGLVRELDSRTIGLKLIGGL